MKLLPPSPVVIGLLLAGAGLLPVEAHKPITSPYTFAEDVAPILRDRCATCHVAGGPAPMPLTTAEETVPWGESIRLELVSGRMPPWSAMSGGKRLPHAEGLTARELNVLLTWVTGGAPPGDAKLSAPAAAAPTWPLGPPDLTLSLPEVGIAADQGEVTREIVLPLDAAARRPLRAVDLRPGTPSLVRSARVTVRSASAGGDVEPLAALWVPGDQPVALPNGIGFAVPDDAALVVTLRLRKTWVHEREAMSDRSTLALYFAEARGVVQRVAVSGQPLMNGVRLLSIYPAPGSTGAPVTVDATAPGGAVTRLLEFAPRTGWDRRYAFDPPYDLPAGTRLRVSSSDAIVLNAVPLVP
jgi:hypothetical protein